MLSDDGDTNGNFTRDSSGASILLISRSHFIWLNENGHCVPEEHLKRADHDFSLVIM
jgi:hypothetical protein